MHFNNHFLDRFSDIQQIGEGTYGILNQTIEGCVFKAYDSKLKRFVALKQLLLNLHDKQEGFPALALREISILKKLDHPNIVKMIEYQIIESSIYLIFEYIDGDLRQFINKLKFIPNQNELRDLSFQILNGINYCHQKGIVHRDLKPQNILITNDGVIKIADFGLSRMIGQQIFRHELTKDISTLWYRAPEIFLGESKYDYSLDIWSLGCILIEFLTVKPLFVAESQIGLLFQIFQFHGTPSIEEWPQIQHYKRFKFSFPKFKPTKIEKVNKLNEQTPNNHEFIQLIMSMIELNPNQRINGLDAINHSFFDQN